MNVSITGSRDYPFLELVQLYILLLSSRIGWKKALESLEEKER